jgi:membrane protease subunit (stomatin/prohibitin family)
LKSQKLLTAPPALKSLIKEPDQGRQEVLFICRKRQMKRQPCPRPLPVLDNTFASRLKLRVPGVLAVQIFLFFMTGFHE